jgi:hypothetical protein
MSLCLMRMDASMQMHSIQANTHTYPVPITHTLRHTNVCRYASLRKGTHLPSEDNFANAPSQASVGAAGAVSLTVLAGKPHDEAPTFKELKTSLTLIYLNDSYSGCPAHVCKRRAQLRQSHTLVHTHLT